MNLTRKPRVDNHVSVSVIIPVYNSASYLRERMDSVCGQTLKDIEIICVDDGSTDDSPEILAAYAKQDPRVSVYLCGHKNAGVARNYGLDRASGEFIISMDADDYCDPAMLEELYTAALEKDADVVVCRSSAKSANSVNKSTGTIKDKLIPQTEDGCFSYKDCPETIFQIFTAWTWDKLCRFEFIKKYDIRWQDLPATNDFSFCFEMLIAAQRIYVVDEYLYTQRRDSSMSITHRLNAAWDCCYRAPLRLRQTLVSWGVYDEVRLSYQNIAMHQLIWYLGKLTGTPKVFKTLYNAIRNQYINDLDLADLDEDCAYEKKEFAFFQIICNNSFDNGIVLMLNYERDAVDYFKRQINKEKRNVIAIKRSRKRLQKSSSYRIGRAVTFLPRLITRKVKKAYRFLSQMPQLIVDKKQRRSADKRICILAYENFHAFIVNSIIQIANYNQHYVEVYTIKEMKKELDEYLGEDSTKIHWHILPKRSGAQLAICQTTSEKIVKRKDLDMIIMPSAEYQYQGYSPVFLHAPKHCEVVAMVHNLNSVFCGQEVDPERCELFAHASAYAVLDELLIKEIERRGLTEKHVYEFPVVFRGNPEILRSRHNQKVTFVITGHIEKERKDFDLAMDVFADLSDYYDRLNLVLLGQAKTTYGKNILGRCKDLIEAGLSVQYYESFVPTAYFQTSMLEADFILGVIRTHYVKDDLDETYNVTKMTGTVTDMIEYAKPSIVPSDLAMPEKLASSTIYYDSADNLRNIIISLLEDGVAANYAVHALENSRKYALDEYKL